MKVKIVLSIMSTHRNTIDNDYDSRELQVNECRLSAFLKGILTRPSNDVESDRAVESSHVESSQIRCI